MKIIPLAFDSLGTRGMATFIKTKDIKIIIDPGVSLSPSRFNLPPHPKEVRRMNKQWKEIRRHSKKSDVLIVTHYHYDHHDPDEVDIYKDKIVFLKDHRKNINMSQRFRSRYFLENLQGIPEKIYFSDNKGFDFNETRIKFSQPMPHGLHSRLGYVTEVLIDDIGKNLKFIHTSDVLGPCLEKQTSFIIRENPDIVFADGPLNFTLKQGIENLIRIVKNSNVKKLIVDHHLLRDISWKEKIQDVFYAAKNRNVKIMTAAEFAGKRNDLLEARRRELWGFYNVNQLPNLGASQHFNQFPRSFNLTQFFRFDNQDV